MFEICNKFNKLICQLEILNTHSDSIISEIMNLNHECQNLLNAFHKGNKFLYALLTQINNQETRMPSYFLLLKI